MQAGRPDPLDGACGCYILTYITAGGTVSVRQTVRGRRRRVLKPRRSRTFSAAPVSKSQPHGRVRLSGPTGRVDPKFCRHRAGGKARPRALPARGRGPAPRRSPPARPAAAPSTWPSPSSRRTPSARSPSTAWRREFSLLLGLERVLSEEEPKLADGTVLSAHQVDALSGTLTALLAEEQRKISGGNGRSNGSASPELLASAAILGLDEPAPANGVAPRRRPRSRTPRRTRSSTRTTRTSSRTTRRTRTSDLGPVARAAPDEDDEDERRARGRAARRRRHRRRGGAGRGGRAGATARSPATGSRRARKRSRSPSSPRTPTPPSASGSSTPPAPARRSPRSASSRPPRPAGC